MKPIKLRESLSVDGVGRVDRDTSTIHDVKVIGLKSANGRRYSRTALKNAAKLYEGIRVFFDHPDGDSNTRKFRERFGRLTNIRPADDGGMLADLKYNPAHAEAEQFLWLAENDPAGMGLSHNAEGRGVREQDGTVLVEEITKVHSVDIVDGPATTVSLYEQDSSMDPTTDPAAQPMPGADADAAGGDDLSSKLAALASDFAAHPELSKEEKIKKLKALIDLMHDGEEDAAQADDAPEPDGDEAPEPTEEEAMEQLGRFKSPAVKWARKKLLRESRRKLATEKGIPGEAITEAFLEQLVVATPKTADKLIEDRKQLLNLGREEKPKNAPAGKGGKVLTPAEIAATIFG